MGCVKIVIYIDTLYIFELRLLTEFGIQILNRKNSTHNGE